ncbi:MAG TPA: enoyl-CoA hydratase-related protein [Euzebyales bacterium]|nr:enoyl-CoA hydratase-related protein [Euzebyales bacterium]
MDQSDVVLVERQGRVAVITLNRPAKLNAVTREMADAYAAQMRAADRDPDVGAIVVTGAGRGFCAGADLGILAAGADALSEFLPVPEDLPQMVLDLPTPVIAAVNGPVAGVGFAYMIGSDIRFAAQGATMSTTFARLGLVAEYGLSWLLPRLIGVQAALDLLLTGRTFDADEATRIGLVQEVLPPERLLDHAIAYGQQLADTTSPYSLANIKAQVYADAERDRATALADTLERMRDSIRRPDLAEALRARAEERPPRFAPLD